MAKNNTPKTKSNKQEAKKGYRQIYLIKTDTTNFRNRLESALGGVAVSYGVRPLMVIDIENAKPPKRRWGERDWFWNETQLSYFLTKGESAKFEPEWWYDQTIYHCSVMVWNLVNKEVIEVWSETGTYPGVDKLGKRVRSSMEAVAEHFSNLEMQKFLSKFM